MTTYTKDVEGLPLKPPQETFVDDPDSVDEIHIDELVFDIRHGLKDVNKLHIYHALVILSQTLNDIIRLQLEPKLFLQFRQQQLAKYGITIEPTDDEVSANSSSELVNPPIQVSPSPVRVSPSPPPHEPPMKIPRRNNSATPPLSPPINFSSRSESFSSDSFTFKQSTPDSLDINYLMDENYGMDNVERENPPYITIETLLKETSLDPVLSAISTDSRDSFTSEYHLNTKGIRKHQNKHLIKSFNLLKKPPLSVLEFLMRIKTYSSSISISSYIHSATVMFKLCILLDIIPLTQMNVYRFLLASIRCSTKALEDVYQKQRAFATVGGVNTRELFKIELGFLYLCNFKLSCSEYLLNNYLKTQFVELSEFCKLHFDNDPSPNQLST